MKYPLSIYGSHDSNISVRTGPDEYRVYELERITGKRYYSLNADPNKYQVLQRMFNYIKEWHGIYSYDIVYYSECEAHTLEAIMNIFSPDSLQQMRHHRGHAYGAMWQSPFEESLIISFDGGGYDIEETTFFNIFKGNKKANTLEKIVTLPLDICSAYTMIAYPLADVKKSSMDSYLAWAGKKMGMVAYGEVNESWLPHFKKFYYGHPDVDHLYTLFNSIGFPSGMNTVTDFTDQANIAATSQKAFSEIFINSVSPFIERSDLPICLTGGGALNIILNQEMYNRYPDRVSVPVNPSDCGLSLGFLLENMPPDSGEMKPVTYNGFPLLINNEKLIINNEGDFSEKFKVLDCSLSDLAIQLVSGKIIGFINGDSEVGPRALGNRSMLAWPGNQWRMDNGEWRMIEGDEKYKLKDKLNRIKDREWYRPVAPVVLEEDASELFIGLHRSPFMSFNYTVNLFSESESFPSVIHNDFTSRIQTVNADQNPVLYKLLSEIKRITGYGILVNTSFNSKGKPILASMEDALSVLENTDLDGLWVDEKLIIKR